MLQRNEAQPSQNARKFFSPHRGAQWQSGGVSAPRGVSAGSRLCAPPFNPNRHLPVNLMRPFTSALLLATTALCVVSPLTAQTEKAAPAARVNSSGGKSPHETTGVVLGARGSSTRVTITYGRPYAKGRKVWGELVKYNVGDRLGSDEATLLLTQGPIQLGTATLPAGAYTLYIVASETGPSKLAISSNIGKWGIPVDETKDIARVDLTKEATKDFVEQLTIGIAKSPDGTAALKISWENTMFSVPVAVAK